MSHVFKQIAEKKFLGNLLALLKPQERLSSLDWGEKYRRFTEEESHFAGHFNKNLIPALEYIYECYDNPLIYIIVCMKASQVGWSELCNTCEGKRIHIDPIKMQLVFPGKEASKTYSREKLKPFFQNTTALRNIVNQDGEKESFNFFKFPGGFMKLTTAGSIANLKTSSIAYIRVEEPDDVRDDVKGQGNTLELLKGRQKTFPIGQKKLVYGGTPTDEDFSKVADGYNQSNKLVFKAECHHCKALVELSLDCIKYDEYQDRYIDPIYGKSNPETAYFECPACLGIWTFEDKNNNIENGKQFGFTDFTGNFSKGWHPKREEITEIFGFHIPELLSTLSDSTFVDLAKKKIQAELAMQKGDEGLMKSYVNNHKGLPYSSNRTSMEADDMKLLRKNYPEGIAPMEGLIITAGIDVQDNRVAVVLRAWGRRDNSWLLSWFEIFGKMTNKDDPAWQELLDKTVKAKIPHILGKDLIVSAVSIDSGDNTELVYDWVLEANKYNPNVFATKGTDRIDTFCPDEIFMEPARMEVGNYSQLRKTLAETKGVTVFPLGAHRAHTEILNRIALNNNADAASNVYYHNEQSYGQYEEQMMSCRAIFNPRTNRLIYKLKPGCRKEAMDAEKNALHAARAIRVNATSEETWLQLEKYVNS